MTEIFERHPVPWRIDDSHVLNCGYERYSTLVVDAEFSYNISLEKQWEHVILVLDPSESEYAPAMELKEAKLLVKFINSITGFKD